MFLYLIGALLVAATVHVVWRTDRTARAIGRVGLLYVLVGYCGVPMIAVSVMSLTSPDQFTFGFESGSPFQLFVSYALLGMGLSAVLALRFKGSYVIGPAVAWATFFAGATFVHLRDLHAHGPPSHGSLLLIFATHGLISLLLLGGLIMSGALSGATE